MFLDIAAGIFLALWTASAYEVTLSPWLLGVSIVCVLLPDSDFIFLKLFPPHTTIGKLIGGHRGFLHYPSFYFFLTPFIYVFFGKIWTFIFLTGTLYHLVHDLFFLGWGIKWFAPFSQRSYKFFPDKNGKILPKFLLAWDPHEEPRVRVEYGTKHWVLDFYFKPSIVSFIEYGFFLLAIFFLYRFAIL